MKHLIALTALTLCLFESSDVLADGPSVDDVPKSAKTNAGLFSGMFGGMADVTIQISDKYLDYLAKPETAMKLAKFQKNYYESLIELGFDKDQAFTLVRDLGNPMIEHGSGRNTD